MITNLESLKKKKYTKVMASGLCMLFALILSYSEENDITENYFVSISSQWGCGVGTAELSMVYVYITIILILGAIFARYFWRYK